MSRRVDYTKIAPEGTFIHDYMDFMSVQETPYAYDFWGSIWLMSLALGRGCIVPRPRAPVFMNWYIMFVSESGVTRKSTGVRQCTKIARKFIDSLEEFMQLIEAKTIPEALELSLHKLSQEHGYAHTAISISELVTFLGREKYNLQMPGLLTDLYDAPELRDGPGTIGRGPTALRNVYVSFLSATTPSWLLRSINPDVIEGGFTSRCIFVVCEHRKRPIPWPREAGDEARAIARLVDRLHICRRDANTYKQVAISPTALEEFSNWYTNRNTSLDPFQSSFESREDAHVLRLAACLAVNDGSWAINVHHIRATIPIIAEAKFDGGLVFTGTGFQSKRVLGVDKIRQVLIAASPDGMSQSEITAACQRHMNAEEIRTALEIMHELTMVQRFEKVKRGRGRPKTIWRAVDTIMQQGAMQDIMDQWEPEKQ